MKPERILLPLDIRECPLEIFSLVEGFSKRPDVTLILLHVVHLSIVSSDSRVYEELALEAQGYLERLAQQCVHSIASTIVHVRFGKPADQILEEAKAEKVELIILPTYGPSFWSRLVSVWKPRACRMVSALAEKIIRDSTCGVFVASVKTRFNCERQWGWPVSQKDVALNSHRSSNESLSNAQKNPQFTFSHSEGADRCLPAPRHL